MSAVLRLLGLILIAACFPVVVLAPVSKGEEAEVSRSLTYLLMAFAPIGFSVITLGLCATAASTPLGRLWRAVRALLLAPPEGEQEELAEALARLARALYAAGVLTSLLAALSLFVMTRRDHWNEAGANPANVANLLTWVMLAPSFALVAAKLVVSPAADALAARAGSDRRLFRDGDDFAQLFLIVPASLVWIVAFLPADKL